MCFYFHLNSVKIFCGALAQAISFFASIFYSEQMPNGSWQKKLFKIKKFPDLCWDLNPQPLVDKIRIIAQDDFGEWIWGVLKFVFNKAVHSFAI